MVTSSIFNCLLRLVVFATIASNGATLPVVSDGPNPLGGLPAVGTFLTPIFLFGLISIAWRSGGYFSKGYLMQLAPLIVAGAGWIVSGGITVIRMIQVKEYADYTSIGFSLGFEYSKSHLC